MIFDEAPKDFSSKYTIVGMFVEYDGKILLLHRIPSKAQGNRWGIPAGKTEIDESLEDGVIRELAEETGIIIDPHNLEYITHVFNRYPEYDFVFHMYHLGFVEKPEVVLNKAEHDAYAWLTIAEAISMPLMDDLAECITKYFTHHHDIDIDDRLLN